MAQVHAVVVLLLSLLVAITSSVALHWEVYEDPACTDWKLCRFFVDTTAADPIVR
jgi:hypothetical protein